MASRTVSVDDTRGVGTRRSRRARRRRSWRWGLAGLLLGVAATLGWYVWERAEPPHPRGVIQKPSHHSVPGLGSDAAAVDGAATIVPADLQFRALMQRGEYDAAVEQYAQAYTAGDAATAHQYREALLRQVSDFIQNGRYGDATALLDTYLAVFYRDTEALVYAGRAYRESRQYRAAIEAFLRAAQQDQHPDKLRMVNGQLSWTINLYVQALRDEDRHQELVELYTYLTHANPRNPYYFIALARAYVAVGRTDDALAALQFVAAEGDAGREAQELIEEIRAGL